MRLHWIEARKAEGLQRLAKLGTVGIPSDRLNPNQLLCWSTVKLVHHLSALVSLFGISACSCAIRSERFEPTGNQHISPVIFSESATAAGFKPQESHYHREGFLLEKSADGKYVTYQSSWCPWLHRLIFTRHSLERWVSRGNQIRTDFLSECAERGMVLRSPD